MLSARSRDVAHVLADALADPDRPDRRDLPLPCAARCRHVSLPVIPGVASPVRHRKARPCGGRASSSLSGVALRDEFIDQCLNVVSSAATRLGRTRTSMESRAVFTQCVQATCGQCRAAAQSQAAARSFGVGVRQLATSSTAHGSSRLSSDRLIWASAKPDSCYHFAPAPRRVVAV